MDLQPKSGAEYVVGVDLGGTNVRAAVINREGKIVGQARNSSEAREGAERVVAQIVLTVQEAIADAKRTLDEMGAVGMAVPGHIEPKTGVIIWSPNFGEIVGGVFKVFLNVPITSPVSEALGIAAYAGNDANMAALGEFRYGAGRGVNDMVMFTLGTGIGSGVVVNGNLLVGSTGGAVELGHHIIVAGGRMCGCGAMGCLEAYCGTQAIVERALRVAQSGEKTFLANKIEECNGERTALTPKMIDEAAVAGDELARYVFEETGYYLGIGISNAMNIFNPVRVVIGGGIRKATGLLDAAKRSAASHSIRSIHQFCQIVEAELGDDAGVMGAAELAWQKVNENHSGGSLSE
jgi:glucokinase